MLPKNETWKTASTALFMLLLIFVQLGFSTLISVATAGTAVLILSKARITIRSTTLISYLLIATASTLSGFIITDISADSYLMQLRIIFIGALYIILTDSSLKPNVNYRYLVVGCTLILTTFVIAQYYFYQRGTALLIPNTFFAISDDGASAYIALQKAIAEGYDLVFRQSATYSEPSYFGMMLISLSMLTLSLYGKSRTGLLLIALLFTASVVAGTFYGQLGIIATILTWKARLKTIFRIILPSALIITILLIILAEPSFQRFEYIISGTDESFLTRMIKPIEIILHNFTNIPFGMPLPAVHDYYLNLGIYQAHEDPPFHNSFYNIFIVHGYLGFPMVVILIKNLKSREEIIFILLLMLQSGAFFSFDKLFVAVFTLALSRNIIESKSLNRTYAK